MGWEPAKPNEARKPLEPAKAWMPDEPAEAPPVPSAAAPGPGPNVTTKNSLMLSIVVSAFCEKRTASGQWEQNDVNADTGMNLRNRQISGRQSISESR